MAIGGLGIFLLVHKKGPNSGTTTESESSSSTHANPVTQAKGATNPGNSTPGTPVNSPPKKRQHAMPKAELKKNTAQPSPTTPSKSDPTEAEIQQIIDSVRKDHPNLPPQEIVAAVNKELSARKITADGDPVTINWTPPNPGPSVIIEDNSSVYGGNVGIWNSGSVVVKAGSRVLSPNMGIVNSPTPPPKDATPPPQGIAITGSDLFGAKYGILHCDGIPLTLSGSNVGGGDTGLVNGSDSPGCKEYAPKPTPELEAFRAAYMIWRKGIAAHAGSMELIQVDFVELRPKFESSLESEHLPEDKKTGRPSSFRSARDGIYEYSQRQRKNPLCPIANTSCDWRSFTMKPEYHEGPEAKKRFDLGMGKLFQKPKPAPKEKSQPKPKLKKASKD